jgi:SPP1 family predicted phage head-tail adaptor
MEAGKLDHRGVIQRFTTSTAGNGFGDPVKSWSDLATVWCDFEPYSVMSRAQAEQFQEGQERVAWDEAKITMRWRSDLTPTPKDRIVVAGKTYDILRVNTTHARQEMFELTCRARADA